MKKLAICCIWSLTAFLVLQPSAFAQKLYAYKNADGRLVITDKPVEKSKKRKYKLVDTFVPKTVRAKEAAQVRARRSKGKSLSHEQLEGLVFPIAKSMSVDPDLVYAVIQVESAANIKALSSKGAIGLMQLMPFTAERFGVTNPWDPRQNIRGGISYLRYLLSYFEGDVDLVLAAYNAGENAVDKYGGIPPYKETKRYVKKVRRYYEQKSHPYDNTAKRKSKLVARKSEERKQARLASAE
ncbi:Lytic transglycosylase domain-containing protein [Sulfidibacter corallicola]|uniref:Lytic transglycosylase domain-containing protein n=1 Tax=Sulfidibacter corallicola TaxID=2818388 RepID=A0A8A4TTN6_SULCO|nr:lytic transglycosylase domain-containing protein [Sulfidibacter corallicola]QTD52737.1 lytic transglycosylase domain-containing protein [Sulfidibacter corallicola]